MITEDVFRISGVCLKEIALVQSRCERLLLLANHHNDHHRRRRRQTKFIEWGAHQTSRPPTQKNITTSLSRSRPFLVLYKAAVAFHNSP